MQLVITSTLMKGLIERVKPSVAEVLVRTQEGWQKNGTGFAISANGLVATCHHVIDGYPEYAVRFGEGSHHTAKVKGARPNSDLAILEIEAETPPLPLGTMDQVEVGREVVWCGFPMYTWLLSWHKGMISHVGDIPMKTAVIQGLQLDGTSNRGNSGGPIIDPTDGRVVGIIASSMGGLDAALQEAFRAARSSAGIIQVGNVDPVAMLIGVVQDMERLIQLGVAYGISVDYLTALRQDI